MPFDRSRYPQDWESISDRIIYERAGNICEWCGVANGSLGYRNDDGSFVYVFQGQIKPGDILENRKKIIRIVLTCAHLDHNPQNCDAANLAALCQRCHLNYDRDQHLQNAARTRYAKKLAAGQIELLTVLYRAE